MIHIRSVDENILNFCKSGLERVVGGVSIACSEEPQTPQADGSILPDICLRLQSCACCTTRRLKARAADRMAKVNEPSVIASEGDMPRVSTIVTQRGPCVDR